MFRGLKLIFIIRKLRYSIVQHCRTHLLMELATGREYMYMYVKISDNLGCEGTFMDYEPIWVSNPLTSVGNC